MVQRQFLGALIDGGMEGNRCGKRPGADVQQWLILGARRRRAPSLRQQDAPNASKEGWYGRIFGEEAASLSKGNGLNVNFTMLIIMVKGAPEVNFWLLGCSI